MTFPVTGGRSNQLSYARKTEHTIAHFRRKEKGFSGILEHAHQTGIRYRNGDCYRTLGGRRCGVGHRALAGATRTGIAALGCVILGVVGSVVHTTAPGAADDRAIRMVLADSRGRSGRAADGAAGRRVRKTFAGGRYFGYTGAIFFHLVRNPTDVSTCLTHSRKLKKRR